MSALEERSSAGPARTPRSEPAPTSLTEEQRALVLAFFAANPNAGYTAACHAAGLSRVTKAEAKALLHGDEEIKNARFKAMGLDEHSAFKAIGEILSDPEHKDRLRASTFALNAIHGWAETRAMEHSGPDGGPVEVADSHVADALDRFTAEVRRVTERAQSDRAVRDVVGDRPALPAGEVRG